MEMLDLIVNQTEEGDTTTLTPRVLPLPVGISTKVSFRAGVASVASN